MLSTATEVQTLFTNARRGKHNLEVLSPLDLAQLLVSIRAGSLGDVDAFRRSRNHANTLLGWACACGHEEVVKALLDAGADPNRTAVSGVEDPRAATTPLVFASLAPPEHAEQCIRLLVAAGASLKRSGYYGVLHEAARASNIPALKTLLELGADPLEQDYLGYSPILDSNGNVVGAECAKLLRAAAAPRLAELKRPALVYKRRKQMLEIGRDLGVATFVKVFADWKGRWEVALVQASVATVSAALREIYPSARIEENAGQRTVADGADVLPMLSLRGSEWSIVVVGHGGRFFKAEHDFAPLLSAKLHARAVRLANCVASLYDQGTMLEEKDWSDDEGHVANASAQAEMDAWFSGHGILLPPITTLSDGYTVQVEVSGLKKGDISRLDLVVIADY